MNESINQSIYVVVVLPYTVHNVPSHAIQTLHVFVVKLVTFFLSLPDFSLVNKNCQYI